MREHNAVLRGQQQLADVLHRRGDELFADGRNIFLAHRALVVENADLDQLVTDEAGVDFLQNRCRQPVLADSHDGIKRVRTRTQGAPLFGGNI